MDKKKSKQPSFEPDYTKYDWSKRHIDPMIRMAWNALIKVEPANREKGQYIGWRTFPDGYREMFKVKHRNYEI